MSKPSLWHLETHHSFCKYCNKQDHTFGTCYKIHDFPNKQVKKNKKISCIAIYFLYFWPEQYNMLLALLAEEEYGGSSVHLAGTPLICLSSSWIIDSGASNHIRTFLSFFIFIFYHSYKCISSIAQWFSSIRDTYRHVFSHSVT